MCASCRERCGRESRASIIAQSLMDTALAIIHAYCFAITRDGITDPNHQSRSSLLPTTTTAPSASSSTTTADADTDADSNNKLEFSSDDVIDEAMELLRHLRDWHSHAHDRRLFALSLQELMSLVRSSSTSIQRSKADDKQRRMQSVAAHMRQLLGLVLAGQLQLEHREEHRATDASLSTRSKLESLELSDSSSSTSSNKPTFKLPIGSTAIAASTNKPLIVLEPEQLIDDASHSTIECSVQPLESRSVEHQIRLNTANLLADLIPLVQKHNQHTKRRFYQLLKANVLQLLPSSSDGATTAAAPSRTQVHSAFLRIALLLGSLSNKSLAVVQTHQSQLQDVAALMVRRRRVVLEHEAVR